MSATNWPDSLKTWVTQCLQQMTVLNKSEAQAELKEVIRAAHADGSMWTVDWSKRTLKSLEPKPGFNKRKNMDSVPSPAAQTTKKAKKPALAATTLDNNAERLAARARRFEREHEIERQKQSGHYQSTNHGYEYSRHVNRKAYSPPSSTSYAGGSLQDRMEGLTTSYSSELRSGGKGSRKKYLNMSVGYTEDEGGNGVDWDRYTIVGTNENLFKNYLRLTSEPDPRDIRPYRILTQTLAELKKRWKQDPNYVWICDQFKSLRQDLTVQRIKNEFTVEVYEIHARMALEANDLVEYNQCQSALRHLYETGIKGHSEEFLAYRILYLLHVRNRSDLNRLISTLTPQVKNVPAVKHALGVQRAMTTNNYHALFTLYAAAPNMGPYLMDHFIERERLGALCTMTKAYLTLPLIFIAKELAFEDASQAHSFLFKHGAAQYVASQPSNGNGLRGDSARVLDCKQAQPRLAQVYEEKTRRVTIQGAI